MQYTIKTFCIMKKDKYFSYFSNNWFSIGIGVLLIMALMQKDINLQVKMGSGSTEPNIEEQTPKKKTKKQTSLSSLASSSSLLELMPSVKKKKKSKQSKVKSPEEQDVRNYIKRFSHVAVKEMDKYNIPASITLAQAILDSQAGQDKSAKRLNNHFGLSCASDWSGSYEQIGQSCYRSYENAWTSFRDHSKYLSQGKFKNLQYLPKDYKEWAKGLEVAGYSQERNYGKQLIEIIEKYNLNQFDS